jgi:hypothetical protein
MTVDGKRLRELLDQARRYGNGSYPSGVVSCLLDALPDLLEVYEAAVQVGVEWMGPNAHGLQVNDGMYRALNKLGRALLDTIDPTRSKP